MSRIEIFTGPNCSYCLRAKVLLERRGLTYDEFDIAQPAHREALLQRLPGARSIPQVFIDGNHAGGCEDLELMASRGLLPQAG
jgi:glutaredoxin 3